VTQFTDLSCVNGGAKPCQVGGVIVGHDFA
jgi:hypothetical protein